MSLLILFPNNLSIQLVSIPCDVPCKLESRYFIINYFHQNLIFAVLLMVNLNSAYYYIVGNLSMIAFIIEIQKLELTNI